MFKHISEILQANQFVQSRLQEVIISLLPNGKIDGNSYVALNPTRADKNLGSFRINLVIGKWIDFATGDRGRDIVSLCAYVKGLSQHQAAQYLLHEFGENLVNQRALSHNILPHIPPKAPKPPKAVDLQGFAPPKVYLKSPKVVKFDPDDAINFVLKIWNECKSADDSPVAEYLASRGYTGKIPKSVKYHPNLYHLPTKAYYPAMVALITKINCNVADKDKNNNQNEVIGIHRTYLSFIDGKTVKAQISPNKMILGQAKGGSVRLSPAGKKLIITEGIETALSIVQATSLPVWAALSATNMQNVIVPPIDITQEIIIAADNDEAGMSAANKLAARLLIEGYIARIATPPELGADFNDLLMEV